MDNDYKGIEKNECPSITFDQVLDDNVNKSEIVIVDTRTPNEFEESHVPDAINIPLMSDYQRHIVGKMYKEVSQDAAIEKGWEFFGPVVQDFLHKFDVYKNRRIYVYCWRGGMRSRIVVNLLRMNGFDAVQIEGGFKSYMNDIVWKGLEEFSKSYKPKFIVLFGNTGTRKTEILKELDAEGLPVLDLEGLAGHKGSVYGSVGSVPNSHKMFSILLYHKLNSLKDERFIFVEGESNKIGNVHLPAFVYEKIKYDIKVIVKADIKTRVGAIKGEYFASDDSIAQLHRASDQIVKIAGKKNVEMLHTLLDSGKHDEFIEWLLLNYYDKRYKHTKENLEYSLDVSSDDIERCTEELKEFYISLIDDKK